MGESSDSFESDYTSSADTSAVSSPELKAKHGSWKDLVTSGSQETIPLLQLLNPSNVTLDLHENNTYKWVRDYSRKLNNKRKERIRFKLPRDEVNVMKQALNEKFDKAYKRIDKVTKASDTEKFFFTGTLYTIFVIGLVMGKHPQYFHVLYTVLFCVLMPIRFITYWKIGYGYFLADLCYYINILLIVYLWVFPDSRKLYVVCCSFAWGTLSFAVITWRNKLVLHSVDKTTSTFIHVLPGCVMYAITHEIPYEIKKQRFAGAVKLQNWEIRNGILYTSVAYFIWQLAYHYFVTIRGADKIKKGQVTSFEYLRKAFANKPIGKFVNSLPGPFPVIAFTLLQYGYQLASMSLCPIWFKYKYAAAVFVSSIFCIASYNGATYYIDFYGKRLQKEVVKLQKELNKAQSQLAAADDDELAYYDAKQP